MSFGESWEARHGRAAQTQAAWLTYARSEIPPRPAFSGLPLTVTPLSQAFGLPLTVTPLSQAFGRTTVADRAGVISDRKGNEHFVSYSPNELE